MAAERFHAVIGDLDGFVFRAATPVGLEHSTGSGLLEGPDGSIAGIQWELSDSPYIMRLEAPAGESWGVYRLGFARPVTALGDLAANLRGLLPKLRILYQRSRVQ